jgi:hypothetical protein
MDLSILTSDQPVVPPPPGEVTDFNHPLDAQRDLVFKVTLAVFVAFSTLCTLLRLWTRAVVVRQFGWDDGRSRSLRSVNLPRRACQLTGESGIGLALVAMVIRPPPPPGCPFEALLTDAPRSRYSTSDSP